MKIAVLVSGTGSNLQALIDAQLSGQLSGQIVGVLSNKADAYALQRATQQQIATTVISHKNYPNRAGFDEAMHQQLLAWQVDVVILAGFMRILTADFVSKWQGKMLNIHPSLLPLYKGINTHQRVLDDKAREHGVSVHFVTPELDGGPVIMQAKVPVLPSDTAQNLAQRVQEQEHHIYPRVAKWFVEGRLKLDGNQVMLDGNALQRPVQHMSG